MEALVHYRKRLVLILVKQTQNFVWVCIIMLIIVICLLMEKKSLSLKLTIKMLTFQLNFVSEVYLMESREVPVQLKYYPFMMEVAMSYLLKSVLWKKKKEKHVDMNVKIIIHTKKIIVGILAHAFGRIASI